MLNLFIRFQDTMEFFAFKTKSKNENEWPKEFFGHWIQFSHDFKQIFNRELQRAIKQKYVVLSIFVTNIILILTFFFFNYDRIENSYN